MLVDGDIRTVVNVEDLPGRMGPSLIVVGLAWLAGGRWSRRRVRVAKALLGREGTLDSEGHVYLDGAQHNLDPSLHGVAPGPVVALHRIEKEGYRDAKIVTSLVSGTKADHVGGLMDERREWRPVVVVAAVLLATPLVASATLGLL